MFIRALTLSWLVFGAGLASAQPVPNPVDVLLQTECSDLPICRPRFVPPESMVEVLGASCWCDESGHLMQAEFQLEVTDASGGRRTVSSRDTYYYDNFARVYEEETDLGVDGSIDDERKYRYDLAGNRVREWHERGVGDASSQFVCDFAPVCAPPYEECSETCEFDRSARCWQRDGACLTIVFEDLPSASCEGGRFFVDGQEAGDYPVWQHSISVGRHQIDVRSAGDCAITGRAVIDATPHAHITLGVSDFH